MQKGGLALLDCWGWPFSLTKWLTADVCWWPGGWVVAQTASFPKRRQAWDKRQGHSFQGWRGQSLGLPRPEGGGVKAQETEDIRASKEGQPAECGSPVTRGISDCTLGHQVRSAPRWWGCCALEQTGASKEVGESGGVGATRGRAKGMLWNQGSRLNWEPGRRMESESVRQCGGQPAKGRSLASRDGGTECSGGPVAGTLHFHCRGHRFSPWSGN